MTDEQIIKAYERCFTLGFDESACYECPFYTATAKCTEDLRDSALNLINRQKSEIERLLQKLQQAKSEAIKEFAEQLKETAYSYSDISGYRSTVVDADSIDNLIKEMTEVQG